MMQASQLQVWTWALALLPIFIGAIASRWWVAFLLGGIIGALNPVIFIFHQEAIQPAKLLFLAPSEIKDILVRQRFERHALGALLGGAASLFGHFVLRQFLLKLRKSPEGPPGENT
jgi:hypothetical protein